MAFQFLCPEGHLLQGDEAHIGRQSQCPQCGTVFVIPRQDEIPAAGQAGALADLLDEFGGGTQADLSTSDDIGAGGVVHIPCPNGHELETPMEMIGLEALCPYCKVKFRLRSQDSLEFKRQQAMQDAKRGKMWFNVAIVTATIVVFGLIVMLIVAIAT